MIEIITGLTATKTGLDLIKGVRELLKPEKVDRTAVQARLGELQEALYQAREALGDAQEAKRNQAHEIADLKRLVEDLKMQADISGDLQMQADGQFLIRKSEKDAGQLIPYCPVCWGEKSKLIPLTPGGLEGNYFCAIHKQTHTTQLRRDKAKEEGEIRIGRSRKTTITPYS